MTDTRDATDNHAENDEPRPPVRRRRRRRRPKRRRYQGRPAPEKVAQETSLSPPPPSPTPLPAVDLSGIIAALEQLQAEIGAYRQGLIEAQRSQTHPVGGRADAVAGVAPAVDDADGDADDAVAPAAPGVDSAPPFVAETVAETVVETVADATSENAVETSDDETDAEDLETEAAAEAVSEVSLAAPEVELPRLYAELAAQLEAGLHRNAAVAIYRDGEELLSYVSTEAGSGVSPPPPPIFRAFSSAKAMVAATVWRLLDRGVLEIDAPVADVWPEFAQRGKSNITLRHVLTHTAGLPIDHGRADVDWQDWGRMADTLAAMDPMYEPGRVIHYHSITFGLLLAEIASRATGIGFEALFEQEVAAPLGLRDTGFALYPRGDDMRDDMRAGDAERRARVAPLHTAADYHDLRMPQKMDWLLDNAILSPGGTGLTTASELARLYAVVCEDGVTADGDLWLSAAAARDVYAVHASCYNIEELAPARIGQGVWLQSYQPNPAAAPDDGSTFGHGGMGTSIAWGDPEHRLAVAVITDTMQSDADNLRRLNRVSAAVREDLGLPVGEDAEFAEVAEVAGD